MQFTSSKTQESSGHFKEMWIQQKELLKITDRQIASSLNCSERTIGRYGHFEDECNLPAFMIGLFNTPELEPLGMAILKSLAEKYDYDFVKRFKPGQINGTLADDILSINQSLGELAKSPNIELDKALRLRAQATKLIQSAYDILGEIEAKVKR